MIHSISITNYILDFLSFSTSFSYSQIDSKDIMVEVNTIRNFVLNYVSYNQNIDKKSDDDKPYTRNVRKVFSQYDDVWMQTQCSDEDLEAFFDWWYYSWKGDRPSLLTRLW